MKVPMSQWSRTGKVVAALLFFAAAIASPLQAADLMLDDTSPPPYAAFGWSFFGLTVVSLAVAAQEYNASQEALDKADKNYKLYKVATTEADALYYRARTEKFHNRAKTAEGRANLGLVLGVIFAVTTYYSFWPEDISAPSLEVSLDGINWRMRF